MILLLIFLLSGGFTVQNDCDLCPLLGGKRSDLNTGEPGYINPRGGFGLGSDYDFLFSVSDGNVKSVSRMGGQLSLIIQDGDFYYIYVGLRKTELKEGDRVECGQQIGIAGKGKNYKYEIYIEVWENENKHNPLEFIKCDL